MTSILDNELVKKYFGEYEPGYARAQTGMALAVLEAMSEPIKTGERYLSLRNLDAGVLVWEYPDSADQFHSHIVRLPQRFQPQGTEEDWPTCEHGQAKGYVCTRCIEEYRAEYRKTGGVPFDDDKPAPQAERCDHSNCAHAGVIRPNKPHDAVEEKVEAKIHEIGALYYRIFTKQYWISVGDFEYQLRELVRLARTRTDL